MKKLTRSESLFLRAQKVIPSGIYGHLAPVSGLPDCFPHYCEKARGHTFEDVDGKRWTDFMCGYGAVLHGFSNPEIETAANSQNANGRVFNQPAEVMIELAEELTKVIDFADWAVFAKNGSDLTTWAIRVAREHSQRPIVVKAKGAYHGVDAWCDPGLGGRIESDRQDIREFEWNDFGQLEDILNQNQDNVACVILTPYHHSSFGPSVMPAEGFWSEVRSLCNRDGVLLILDEVRTGGRLHDGGSHRYFGFQPDLSIFSKALGNGYSISACVGKRRYEKSSMEVFLTGSCWNDAVAMSAALCSLRISQRDGVAESVLRKGRFFSDGLEKIALNHGFSLSMTGPSSMPYPWFEGDNDLFLLQSFCRLAAAEGLFFHPHHNWFISNAHNDDSLSKALNQVDRFMPMLREASL